MYYVGLESESFNILTARVSDSRGRGFNRSKSWDWLLKTLPRMARISSAIDHDEAVLIDSVLYIIITALR